ncbi:MAG TPA: hypothetical protein VGK45_09065, partial [Thermoanaerobaculia bacterium]
STGSSPGRRMSPMEHIRRWSWMPAARRSIWRSCRRRTFDLVFERGFETCSLRDQVFLGSIDVVMDHVVVARKPTKITIPKCRYHYVVKFVCGVNEVSSEGCSPVRAGRYATEINIYNGYCSDARRVTGSSCRRTPRRWTTAAASPSCSGSR